jgi:hypothetical protein
LEKRKRKRRSRKGRQKRASKESGSKEPNLKVSGVPPEADQVSEKKNKNTET